MIYALDGVVPRFEGDAFWVAPTACVIGDVRFGRDASVWWGAVLRGDNEPIVLGAGSNVQDNCVLHTDPGFPLEIGADVTIGHAAILHGCTIGDGTLVGMGATVLNGARIGRNCLLGAGALVTEGREIPDHSVVLGMPGRVTGTVGDEQARRMIEGAARYVANWQRYGVVARPRGRLARLRAAVLGGQRRPGPCPGSTKGLAPWIP